MNTITLMNEIRLDCETFIEITLNSILLTKRQIKMYEEMIVQAEKAYDLNHAADIKYNKLPEIERKLVVEKTALLKAIALSAYKVIEAI